MVRYILLERREDAWLIIVRALDWKSLPILDSNHSPISEHRERRVNRICRSS